MSGRTANSDRIFGMGEDFNFTDFEDLGLEEGIVEICPGLEKKIGMGTATLGSGEKLW